MLSTTTDAWCVNCSQNNNVLHPHKGQRHRQRFSVLKSLRRSCFICHSKIYFSSNFQCQLCNCVTHRRCQAKVKASYHVTEASNDRLTDLKNNVGHQSQRLVKWLSKQVKWPVANKKQSNKIETVSQEEKSDDVSVVDDDDEVFTENANFGVNVTFQSPVLNVQSDDISLCATWPPIGRKLFKAKEDSLGGSESGFEDCDPSDELEDNETMGEWSIPFRDLQVGRKIRTGRRQNVYQGRWHGDVMIHTFHASSAAETAQFWREVSYMSIIRHENLALFMGICLDMPQLAIVTSVRKARSLYDHIHVKKEHCQLPTKIHIARQVAQGMSYLHAKGITHRKLNSKNILMENKVKVCLLDQGMARQDLDRDDYGCIPNGHLTYVSPEIMKSLAVQPPKLINTSTYTQESDIYAFGTVLYELFAEKWPFQGHAPHSIIWQIGTGQVQSLHTIQCSSGLKGLISDCWSHQPTRRPAFNHILRMVQENVVLHRRHSSSEPENLNRLGFNTSILK